MEKVMLRIKYLAKKITSVQDLKNVSKKTQ